MTTPTPRPGRGVAALAGKRRRVHRLLGSAPLWMVIGAALSEPAVRLLDAVGVQNPRVPLRVAVACLAVALYSRKWWEFIAVRTPIVAVLPFTVVGFTLVASLLALVLTNAAAAAGFSGMAAGCAIGVALYVPLLVRRRRALRRLN